MTRTSPYPMPRSMIEHELRSIRRHLMGFDRCPPVVRIRQRGAEFTRPSIDLILVTSRPVDSSPLVAAFARTMNLLWWGAEAESQTAEEALDACDWIVKALTKGGLRRGSDVPLLDFSGDDPVETGHIIDIDPSSVDARPTPDGYGLWACAVDFRYSSATDWPLEEIPSITSIEGFGKPKVRVVMDD